MPATSSCTTMNYRLIDSQGTMMGAVVWRLKRVLGIGSTFLGASSILSEENKRSLLGYFWCEVSLNGIWGFSLLFFSHVNHAGDRVGLLSAFFPWPPHASPEGNMILIRVLEQSAPVSFRGSPSLLPSFSILSFEEQDLLQ